MPTRSAQGAWVRARKASRINPSCDPPASAARATLAGLVSASGFFPQALISTDRSSRFPEQLTRAGKGGQQEKGECPQMPMHQQAHRVDREVLTNQVVTRRTN